MYHVGGAFYNKCAIGLFPILGSKAIPAPQEHRLCLCLLHAQSVSSCCAPQQLALLNIYNDDIIGPSALWAMMTSSGCQLCGLDAMVLATIGTS